MSDMEYSLDMAAAATIAMLKAEIERLTRERDDVAKKMREAILRAIDEKAPASGSPGWSWYADAREAAEMAEIEE